MAKLELVSRNLELEGNANGSYSLAAVTEGLWDWDAVVKATHPIGCAYQQSCSFNLFVKDGVVVREEQAARYPPLSDPVMPDLNPRGCNKGACFAGRMYDPTRVKYPLKRAGLRGEGKWQRISWEEALTEIADRMIDVLTTDGPDVIVQGGGTGTGGGTTAFSPFFVSLGSPQPIISADSGDECQGVAVTFGKAVFADSAHSWFYTKMIWVWGGNPGYTNIPNYHFLSEARYHGTKMVVISPDYNASAVHADTWVPVKIGSDAALALGMAQVVLSENLHDAQAIREYTDLPLLVREDNGRFLREKDTKRGGQDDVFYLWDEGAKRLTEAPRKSLALEGKVPALEGNYEVTTIQGKVRVTPVMALLKRHLDQDYTPEKASAICGVPTEVIRSLAREFATCGGVVNTSTTLWGKFYHGDLIERSMSLLFVICGYVGKKGANYNAVPQMAVDTAVGGDTRRGAQMMLAAATADPRFAQWQQAGFTDEMILYEYVRDAVAAGHASPTSLFYMVHGGLREISEKNNSWDPYLKRPLAAYVREALETKQQPLTPGPEQRPRILFNVGGNFLRRARGTGELIKNLLPKLDLMVTVDWRMSSSALYSDYILPSCSWFEKHAIMLMGRPTSPFIHMIDKATQPLYESMSEWRMAILLARKLAERAKGRGVESYRDHRGVERRFDQVESRITVGGLYTEEDEEDVNRDTFLNAANIEQMDWEDFKAEGISPYTKLGRVTRSIENACDFVPGGAIVSLSWHTEKKQPFPTLTRRIQFYIDHELYLELGEALPTHKDPPKAGGDYPLVMTGGHARWSLHSSWVDNTVMLRLHRGGPLMCMSLADARARGISDGEMAEVFNDLGAFQVQAQVIAGTAPGQVIVYHSWENYQFPGKRHFKIVQASPINPVELAGGYFHLRSNTQQCHPGFSDRDTRVEVRKVL